MISKRNREKGVDCWRRRSLLISLLDLVGILEFGFGDEADARDFVSLVNKGYTVSSGKELSDDLICVSIIYDDYQGKGTSNSSRCLCWDEDAGRLYDRCWYVARRFSMRVCPFGTKIKRR